MKMSHNGVDYFEFDAEKLVEWIASSKVYVIAGGGGYRRPQGARGLPLDGWPKRHDGKTFFPEQYWIDKVRKATRAEQRSNKNRSEREKRLKRVAAVVQAGIPLKPVIDRIKNHEMDQLLDALEELIANKEGT